MEAWVKALVPTKALFSVDIWEAMAPRINADDAMLNSIADGGSYNSVRRYIEEATSVTHNDEDGNQALHLAARFARLMFHILA
jgi:hypothetical protein